MELPHIGDHCVQPGCNQLDYLPITCSLCNNKYCKDHHRYEDHSCPESYKVDVQVPICPLCEKPVPGKRGLAPDLAVNEHLENNCQSKSKKIYSNRCSVSGCKIKELVSIQCDSCKSNFCLRHRHTVDHDCKGPVATRRELTSSGSIFKNWINGSSMSNSNRTKTNQSSKPIQNSNRVNAVKNNSRSNGILQVSPTVREANVSTFQGSLSEEEALRKAIMQSQEVVLPKNEASNSEDEDLAKAIALSLEEQPNSSSPSDRRNDHTSSSDCSVS